MACETVLCYGGEMESEKVKNAIVKELTGRSPGNNTGMLVGMVISLTILSALGAGAAVVSNLSADEGISGVSLFIGALGGVCIGFLGGFIGDKMGWLDKDLEGVAENLTYGAEDYIADNLGLKSWNYDAERQNEVAAAGCMLASFQFLFGTLWGSFKYFTGGGKDPDQGFRGPTAVAMYLHQAGRTSQAGVVNGLKESGLPEGETIRGLAILKKIGFIVGGPEGFLLTQKAVDECTAL